MKKNIKNILLKYREEKLFYLFLWNEWAEIRQQGYDLTWQVGEFVTRLEWVRDNLEGINHWISKEARKKKYKYASFGSSTAGLGR